MTTAIERAGGKGFSWAVVFPGGRGVEMVRLIGAAGLVCTQHPVIDGVQVLVYGRERECRTALLIALAATENLA